MQNENWGLQKRDANPDLPTLQWVVMLFMAALRELLAAVVAAVCDT